MRAYCTTLPGRAPVIAPSRTTGSPPTSTSRTPTGNCIGSSKVARSATVAASKHHEVGAQALRHQPAVGEAEGLRGLRRHLAHRLLEGQRPRARARSGRGCADRCRRRAGAAGRRAGRRCRRSRRAGRRKRSTTASSCENEIMATPMRSSQEQVEGGLERVLAPGRARPRPGVLPSHSGMAAGRDVGDDDALRARSTSRSCPSPRARDRPSARAAARAPRGSRRRPQRGLGAAVVRPRRQDRAQQRAARDVGVLVGGEAQALARAPASRRRHHVARRGPVLAARDLEVRDVHRAAGLARHADHLVQRLQDAVALAAHVDDERPAGLRQHAARARSARRCRRSSTAGR